MSEEATNPINNQSTNQSINQSKDIKLNESLHTFPDTAEWKRKENILEFLVIFLLQKLKVILERSNEFSKQKSQYICKQVKMFMSY